MHSHEASMALERSGYSNRQGHFTAHLMSRCKQVMQPAHGTSGIPVRRAWTSCSSQCCEFTVLLMEIRFVGLFVLK